MVLKKSFYNQNTLKVARDLLGCFLVRKFSDGKISKFIIIETEAYCGPNDLASHASRGKTQRSEVMFGEAGMIYIYLVYGMYYMLNIVTEKKDYPAAVLIRAVESDSKNSGFENAKLNGPGKLCRILKIDKSFNGLSIYNKKNGLWIERGRLKKTSQIKKTPRIGVDYAGEYKDKPWRFVLEKKSGSTF